MCQVRNRFADSMHFCKLFPNTTFRTILLPATKKGLKEFSPPLCKEFWFFFFSFHPKEENCCTQISYISPKQSYFAALLIAQFPACGILPSLPKVWVVLSNSLNRHYAVIYGFRYEYMHFIWGQLSTQVLRYHQDKDLTDR